MNESGTGQSRRLQLRSMLAAVSVVTGIFDQLVKFWAVNALQQGEAVPVIPGFFNLTLHYNPGAAFGIMAGLPNGTREIALAATTALALSCIVYFLARNLFESIWGHQAIGLIIGGAAGNIIDRLRLGQVVDFLDFFIGQYHWPAFNLADSAICVGVAILLVLPPHGPPPGTVKNS